jgi:hypothetical protein
MDNSETGRVRDKHNDGQLNHNLISKKGKIYAEEIFTYADAYIKVVGLERGPLSLVSTTEKLLDRKVAAPV